MQSPAPDPLGSLPEESILEQLSAIGLRVRRNWWAVVAVAALGGAVAVYHTMKLPQFYQASVTLLVDSRPPRVLAQTTEVNPEEQMMDRERFINSQIRIIGSEAMSNRVEERLHQPEGSLAGRVVAFADPRSYALELTVSDLDPQKATTLVKAFADEYLLMSTQDRTGVASSAAKFLDGQTQDERTRLEDDEKRLYDFDKVNELPASNFEESHKIASSTLEALHAQAAQAKAAGIKLKAQLDEIQASEGKPDLQRALLQKEQVLSAEGQINTPAYRYVMLQEQLVQLKVRYGDQHPKVIEAKEGLQQVEKLLAQEIETAKEAIQAKVHANEVEQTLLRNAIAEETHKAVALRQKELAYNQLKRQLDEDRDNYSLLAKRQKEIELQATLKQGYVRWLEGPNAAAPVSRQMPRNVALGIVLGLLLGVGLAFLIDLVDDTVKSPMEAERDLEGTLLGIMMSVPAASGGPREETEALRAEHLVRNPRSVIAEQCHTFTTHIYSLFLDGPPRALMVVSSAVEDGKTLVAVNLALTAAARGKRVLLVDCDLRRGRLHRLFKLPKKDGLFELVTHKTKLTEATRTTFIPHVDVVTAGDVPDKLSPLRVFEHKELLTVIEEMKQSYDLVVFDTPPVPVVSDALLLSPMIDGAVGVARANKTSRKAARRLVEQLQTARVNFLGWVLNDVPEKEMRSKYYYRYGYYNRGYYADKPTANAD